MTIRSGCVVSHGRFRPHPPKPPDSREEKATRGILVRRGGLQTKGERVLREEIEEALAALKRIRTEDEKVPALASVRVEVARDLLVKAKKGIDLNHKPIRSGYHALS